MADVPYATIFYSVMKKQFIYLMISLIFAGCKSDDIELPETELPEIKISYEIQDAEGLVINRLKLFGSDLYAATEAGVY